MNDLPAKRNDAYLTRYENADPFKAFASEAGVGIVGARLACVKGEWLAGADQTPVATGTTMLAIVETATRGWIKFGPDGVVGADVGLVKDGFRAFHRLALGDNDESQWITGPDGQPRDPWAKYYAVQLVQMSPPHGDMTFTSNSNGGRVALQDLCGAYAADRHQHEGQYPVVSLDVVARRSRYGNIKGPSFAVIGWASVEDVRAGKKKPPKAAKAKADGDAGIRWRDEDTD